MVRGTGRLPGQILAAPSTGVYAIILLRLKKSWDDGLLAGVGTGRGGHILQNIAKLYVILKLSNYDIYIYVPFNTSTIKIIKTQYIT